MFPSSKLQWWAKAAAAVRREPKKATAFAALALVMGGLWGRVLLCGGEVARSAMASAAGPTPTLAANEAALQSAGDADALLAWVRAPVAPLSRNLFTVNLDYFPQDGAQAEVSGATRSDGFWEELAKSLASRADQQRERQIFVQNVRSQAAALRLQTILMGPEPKALIGGQLVKEGDIVASFRVLKIEARRILVEREGIRLEIQMK